METHVTLGNKVTVKRIVMNLIGYSFYGLLFGIAGLGELSHFLFHFQFQTCLIIAIVGFITMMLIIVPFNVMNDFMEVNENDIKIYQYKGFFNKLSGMFEYIISKKIAPQYIINTAKIKSLVLNYEPYYMFRQIKGYQLKMTYVFDDDTTLDIIPLGTHDMKNGHFEKAFQLLEKNNITIVDQYHLRKVLSTNGNAWFLYVDSL